MKKFKISISLKLALILLLVFILFLFFLTYLNITHLDDFFVDNYSEKGEALARSFDVSLGYLSDINNTTALQDFVNATMASNPEILQLRIFRPNEEDKLQVVASSTLIDRGMIGDRYHNFSYCRSVDSREHIVVYYLDERREIPVITIIVPINQSTSIYGIYEIVFSMQQAYIDLARSINFLVAVAVVSFFFLFLILLILLRYSIVKPIITLRNVARKVGRGDLSARVNILSKDELGDLAYSFNQMTRDLKNSQEKIERQNKTLQGLLKQKDIFIGQLGHDLKNPLTPLVGLLPIIESQEKDPNLKKHLQVIRSNVEYMRELIFKTLELARLRSSSVKLNFENLVLADEIDHVIKSQKIFLKKHYVTVENMVDAYLTVSADRLLLTELLKNLISNSVKYTPHSKGKILFSAKNKNAKVQVDLKDTGIGMTKKQLEWIFDEFYRVEQSGDHYESHGLGLSICKHIVKLHGGKIWATSAGKGKGSTFSFTLPKGKT